MEEEKLHGFKLNIFHILKEGIELYKENFKLFIFISLIGLLINLFTSVSNYLEKIILDPILLIVYVLINLILSIILMFLSLRVYVALIICVRERYIDNQISIRKALSDSKDYLWRYLGVNIIFTLILFVPILIQILTVRFMEISILKYLIIILISIPIIYFSTVYNFAPLIVILEKNKVKYFNMSKKLVEGDFWKIVLLLFISSLIFSIPSFYLSYLKTSMKEISPFIQYTSSIMIQIFKTFIKPFSISISIIAYYTLRKAKIYRQFRDV